MIHNNLILKYLIFFIFTFSVFGKVYSQFPPPAGYPGSTAIYMDSSVFIAWATGCTVKRGLQNIADSSLGYASSGDSSCAVGKAGENGVVSLGDGGSAVLTFASPVKNGPGWDFAVFENAFNDSFLELAFVEVSSDGIHYYRFHATSLTQDTVQIGTYGSVDATKINNLAGKYRVLYGTPFDLDELKDEPGLNVNNINYIKIIDVVGCIQVPYCTYDYYGNKVNDPWPTPFPSSGFDLDAVGVIHQVSNSAGNELIENSLNIYPDPVRKNDLLTLTYKGEFIPHAKIEITDITGRTRAFYRFTGNAIKIDTNDFLPGIYLLRFRSNRINIIKKILIL